MIQHYQFGQLQYTFILTAVETNILKMETDKRWAEGARQEIRTAATTCHIAQPDSPTACAKTV